MELVFKVFTSWGEEVKVTGAVVDGDHTLTEEVVVDHVLDAHPGEGVVEVVHDGVAD